MTTLKQYETEIVNEVRLELGRRPDTRVFRNNVGALALPNGRWLQYGLCAGSSDLIGLRSVTITPDMVGQQVAIFMALEGKRNATYATVDQRNFIAMVKMLGGRAGIFRNLVDAQRISDGLK